MAAEPRARPDMLDRVYGWLLARHPPDFRERFQPEMIELFRARRAAARCRGRAARLVFPAIALLDLAGSVWRERGRHGGRASGATARLAAGLGDDLRTAGRRLRRSPALTLAVAGLLALAIGSATVVFSVVNTILLRPLPYPDPDRLVLLWDARANSDHIVVGAHEFPEWARSNRTFDAMAAMIYDEGLHVTGGGEPVSLLGIRVSATFFPVMGVTPAIGRAFTVNEDIEGRGQVAVLSDRLWRERFGADRSVLGREIRLNDRPYEVIGVMPPGFAFPPGSARGMPAVWTPIAEPIERYRGRHYVYVVGRLKSAVTVAQAQADMSTIAASIATALPEFNRGHGVNVVALHDDLVHDARSSLLLLLGAVGGLVLIGCTNVAGLLLARGLARRREVGLELALGATRLRIARQLFVESLVLSLAGGALGLVVADWLTRVVPALVPPDVLTIDAVRIDGTVLLFTLGVSVMTGLLFGMAPAMQLRRVGFATALRRGGRSLVGGDHPRVRRVLVSVQVALAVMLVLGAGLMMRGLVALQRVDPGFATDRTLAVDLSLRGPRYADAHQQREFFQTLDARLAAIPGASSVGAANNLPLAGNTSDIAIRIEGRPAPAPGDEPAAQYRVVSTGFFTTIGMPMVAGRSFTTADARLAVPLIRWYPGAPFPALFDRPQARPVAVINESMARIYWPNETPLERRFRALESPWLTVVGVVADTHTVTLRGSTGPEFYLSDLQEPQNGMGVLIRASVPPAGLTAAVRETLRQLDPQLPVTSIRTMDEVVGASFSQPRFMSTLLGVFALMAIVLMTAGVYGLIAFTTAQRLPEMGVRLALGAPRGQIHRLVLEDALTMTVVGVGAGLAAAAGLGRLIADQLFGITPTDRATYVLVAGVVMIVVTIACWLPARRAARVDPVVVLRQE